jgi:hypothetical protein
VHTARAMFVFFLCCTYRATEMHHHYHQASGGLVAIRRID